MSLTNVLSRLMRRSAPSRHRREKTHMKPAPDGRSFLPGLEFLEDRTVLTTWTVTSPADSGDGSLRAMIAATPDPERLLGRARQGDTAALGQLLALARNYLELLARVPRQKGGRSSFQIGLPGQHPYGKW
jgi:hypothetical protein